MKSSEILASTDRTSWSRIWMVLKYLWPSIKPMVIIYPLLSIMFAMLMNSAVNHHSSLALQLMSLLSYVVMFSPCFFSRQPNNEVFYSLPALGYEKVSAIFLVVLVVVPVLLLPTKIYGLFFVDDSRVLDLYSQALHASMTPRDIIMGLAVLFACEGAALWAVFAAKTHRALKACGAALGMMLAYMLCCFVIGFFTAISGGDVAEVSGMCNRIVSVLACVATIFVFYKSAKVISRKQV